jgi:hypothetical protein
MHADAPRQSRLSESPSASQLSQSRHIYSKPTRHRPTTDPFSRGHVCDADTSAYRRAGPDHTCVDLSATAARHLDKQPSALLCGQPGPVSLDFIDWRPPLELVS